ncbi:hypothetical protein F2P44_30810 [Massilia sp. CCM 8695]|uniref:AP2 domain-containing protein n=1 Tax=Massilia frigida TaxID=2609281 RepID=A0ABX0NDT0_9BURK|nr:AP2 domain-containing protein [Massilia frigida]NHZ83626.1 hypothetical protein [Massilia frigida]
MKINMRPATKLRHAHTPDRIGIYRIPHATAGHVLHVVLRRNRKIFTKRFWEHRCGGEAAALQMAQAWRDTIVAKHAPISLAQFCSILRRNNTSGIAGVARREKRYSTRLGEDVTNEYWIARIPRCDGTTFSRSFPVALLGEVEAKSLAIAAREQGLAELDGALFRAQMQPVLVSSRAHMVALEAMLNQPAERRALRAQERALGERERQARREVAAETLRAADARRLAYLAAPSNRTGVPYIGRYQTKGGTGNWRVSIERAGRKYRKTFSDSVFGGADSALAAAETWRDTIFRDIPTPRIAEVVSRINITNTSGTAGVFYSHPSGKTKNGSWVARSPQVKGSTMRSKRFSVEKYGREGALALAVAARAAFTAELAGRRSLHHRAVWQMQQSLARVEPQDPIHPT